MAPAPASADLEAGSPPKGKAEGLAAAPAGTCAAAPESSGAEVSARKASALRSWQWKADAADHKMLAVDEDPCDNLPNVLQAIDDRSGYTQPHKQDFQRLELQSRLLELLSEQCSSGIGVLQSTIVDMFSCTYSYDMPAYFYTPEEIDEGCVSDPTEPLCIALQVGVDDRLVVTSETFEWMVSDISTFELARLLDLYGDYVHSMEMAWQVTTLEKSNPELRDTNRIKNAAGVCVYDEYAYISDSVQHVIFRVNMLTDEISTMCGIRGKPGFHDGPREVARFNSPSGLAMCAWSGTLYVCDTSNDAIRAVAIPSGTVQTLTLNCVDSDVRLITPIAICTVRGDYEYDEEEQEDEDDDNDVRDGDLDDEDDDEEDGLGGRHAPLLEGISEEPDEEILDNSRRSTQTGPLRREMTYTLANNEPPAQKRGKLMNASSNRNLSRSGTKDCYSTASSRRASSFFGSASRRTSGYISSMSSVSSRRTSTHFSMTPGESAKDSLRECAEEEEQMGHNLAVTSDHCVFLVSPEKGEFVVVAGSPTEYGYRDAYKGPEARFSSLKGIICIRNCIFVADHWNNVVRCVNLKTRSVDTVLDFNPCGPLSLSVSSSGSVYVLDTECINACNILKVCSAPCTSKDAEGALGTTMFQMIQDSIGRSRHSSFSSNGSDADWFMGSAFVQEMSRRGSAQEMAAGSEPQSGRSSRRESRRDSQQEDGNGFSVGDVSKLGPKANGPARNRPDHSMPFHGGHEAHSKGSRRKSSQHKTTDFHDGTSDSNPGLPHVPHALRSLVPGASLHPALIQMTMRGQQEKDGHKSMRNSALSGSQFHVSVVSSVPDDDFENTPEFFSFLNPKHESPWKRIPIGTLSHVYQEAVGQVTGTTPLALAYWDATDSDAAAVRYCRSPQQLLICASEFPSVLKVFPPRKSPPNENGRFRAVAVDIDRVVMADSDSNQVFVVNHTKRTKDKIAGCGKAGYLDGPLDVCRMNRPSSVSLDPKTHHIYVADAGNHRIRSIDLSTGFMRTVCGNGVKGNQDSNDIRHQSLDSPFDIHFMHPGHLLISCADNSIRRLDLKTSQLETVLIGS
eukprot:TRINITY_DN22473_c0_g2_i1.p1 TRINITY_DN22473_c0_g2~~TRINITY_DN22473_c0_g2_i1.p1  ORF type:complete len:1092 (+),score=164.75 TRINITY_DN22473_c0_g2_i1:57-3278(+)